MQVETVITDVEQDLSSGWFKIVTPNGSFSTKLPELGTEALSLKGKPVLLDYTENVVTKPAADGSGMRTYRNLYYNRAGEIAPAGNGGFTQAGTPQPQPTGVAQESFSPPQPQERSKMGRDEVWRICLSVGVKAAIDTLPLMPNEQRTFQIQKEIAIAWGKFLFYAQTPPPLEEAPPTVPTPASGFATSPAGSNDTSHEGPPPHTDSDIPY